MSAHRNLPARPSLEFEKKEAKALLRRLRAGESDALARARERHAPFAHTAPDQFRLADALLIQAREYGFTSWPRLVRYLEELERVRLGRALNSFAGVEREEQMARSMLRGHQRRQVGAARLFAAYVPRFYGLSLEQVFATPATEEEAKLAWARHRGAIGWEEFIGQPLIEGPRDPDATVATPLIDAGDLEGLKRFVAQRPELLRQGRTRPHKRWSLPLAILHKERILGREAMRPFIEWFAAEGIDLADEMGHLLCGRMKFPAEDVRWLLDRGADPNWCAPNGIPLLEHALLIYWNREAVDLLAARARPRMALWIAAGLGDVEGVHRSLDAKGMPLPGAVALRPPFDAVGALGVVAHPEPDDEELLAETLFVAAINDRPQVIEYLASRGAPIDSRIYGGTLLSVAVGNAMADVVEVLVRAGADLDIPTGDSNGTPREMGRSFFRPDDPARRRVAALCGWDPDTILAERGSTDDTT